MRPPMACSCSALAGNVGGAQLHAAQFTVSGHAHQVNQPAEVAGAAALCPGLVVGLGQLVLGQAQGDWFFMHQALYRTGVLACELRRGSHVLLGIDCYNVLASLLEIPACQ